MSERDAFKNRSTSKLDVETVVEMRRWKRSIENPSLEQMEERYNLPGATISRALRGVTWENANDREAPIPHFRDRTLT